MLTVWISRPRHRAGALAAALRARGLTPLLCPALEIADAETAPAGGILLNAYLPQAERFAVNIFVSREAAARVARALPAAGRPLPALAVGRGTAAALPPRYRLLQPAAAIGDSMRLLAAPLPPGAAAALGGSDADAALPSPPLLAALRARGAQVTPVVCYTRRAAAADESLNRRGRGGEIHAAVAYSGDSLSSMLGMTAPDNGWLLALPLFVIHPNIAAAAERLGFKHITVAGAAMAETIAQTLAAGQ